MSKSSTIIRLMHNLIPFNQLNGSDDSDKDLIADYYQCIVECDGNMSVCKNICKEVFLD